MRKLTIVCLFIIVLIITSIIITVQGINYDGQDETYIKSDKIISNYALEEPLPCTNSRYKAWFGAS